MNATQLATLALRLMGIYCLIEAVPVLGMLGSLVFFAQHSSEGGILGAVMASLLPGVLLLASGILLLVKSVAWGRRLAEPIVGEAPQPLASLANLPDLAFAVAGVLIFASALPHLFSSLNYLGSSFFAENRSQSPEWTYRIGDLSSSVGTLLQASLGAFLFFRARGFASFWRQLRTFGTPKPPAE